MSIRPRTQVALEVPPPGKGRREGPARGSGTTGLRRSRRLSEAESEGCTGAGR